MHLLQGRTRGSKSRSPPPAQWTRASILQTGRAYPSVHAPESNPAELVETIKDQKGQRFVRALSEGTRAMLRAMTEAGLPPPEYTVADAETIVTLRIDTSKHERPTERASEFANLYPLLVTGHLPADARRAVLNTLRDRLEAEGWFIDRFAHGRINAHVAGNDFPLPEAVRRVVRIFPGSVFALREFHGRSYLVVDYTVEVKSVLTFADLQRRGHELGRFVGRWATAKTREGWSDALIEAVGSAEARVSPRDQGRVEHVAFHGVIPNLNLTEIRRELGRRLTCQPRLSGAALLPLRALRESDRRRRRRQSVRSPKESSRSVS